METKIWKQFWNALWESNTFSRTFPSPKETKDSCAMSTKSNQIAELLKRRRWRKITFSKFKEMKKVNGWGKHVKVVSLMKILLKNTWRETIRRWVGTKCLFTRLSLSLVNEANKRILHVLDVVKPLEDGAECFYQIISFPFSIFLTIAKEENGWKEW